MTDMANKLETGNSNSLEVSFKPGQKLRDVEKLVILTTLRAKGFNRTHAARTLGIGIRTLQRKLKAYGTHHEAGEHFGEESSSILNAGCN